MLQHCSEEFSVPGVLCSIAGDNSSGISIWMIQLVTQNDKTVVEVETVDKSQRILDSYTVGVSLLMLRCWK